MADKLLLVDGNALVHRAYHALPPLNSPDGKLVNAVYGFVSSLLSAIAIHKPRYLVVAFDVAGRTFRNELYEQYKATRQPADQQLYDQIPVIQDLLRVMRVPIFGIEGYEADDVIATIVKQAKGVETIIVTGDSDALQLVNDRVKVYSVSRGDKQAVTYDVKGVQDRFGVLPGSLADFKSLVGDPSDNIKGVPGIGPKTAQELIKQHGSLERIAAEVPTVKPYGEQLKLAKKIITLVSNVPLQFKLKDAQLKDYDRRRFEQELLTLGFKSLVKRLPPQHHQLFSV